MHCMKVVSNLAMLIALALANQVFAETSAKIGSPENAFAKGNAEKGQQIASQVCAGCHNADGNSTIPANPILAGQHAEYITKQLINFKARDNMPAERNSPVMAAMVAPLSPDDMKNLGAYYTSQNPKPGVAKDKKLAEQGEKIYRGGNIESGVPACAGCHSPNGVGIPPFYPRLAGQHAEYTVAQLRAFRTEQRANDVNSVMRGIVTRMSEKEIQAVAEFISGLR
ncbi:MAG: c-type cytochrome [Nitrosomonadaceae bacterium]